MVLDFDAELVVVAVAAGKSVGCLSFSREGLVQNLFAYAALLLAGLFTENFPLAMKIFPTSRNIVHPFPSAPLWGTPSILFKEGCVKKVFKVH